MSSNRTALTAFSDLMKGFMTLPWTATVYGAPRQ